MNLIYDRTAQDVETAKAQRGTTLTPLKGCYNYTDLNRVEAAVKTIAAELNAAGYPVEVLPVLKGQSKLPTGYTELEYIAGTGTQYIDTGLVCNKNDYYEIDMDIHLISSNAYAGANGYLQYQASIVGDARQSLKIVYQNNTEKTYVNGVLKLTNDWSSFDGLNVKIGLLKLGDANDTWYTAGGTQSGKIYSVILRRSGILVRDFAPCKTPSGTVGLYDTVSEQFYANAGTGSFTAGADIGQAEDRDWLPGDTVTREQWETYLENVRRLRAAHYTLAETGELPAPGDKLKYTGANTIERILYEIDLLIGYMKENYRRCGTFRAGANAVHLPLKGSV